MKILPHYVLAPLFYVAVAVAGRLFTAQGTGMWYQSILKPDYTPPGSFIGIVWTVIYILSAVSLIAFTNAARGKALFLPITALYIINGILNAAWSYLFFTAHSLGLAVVDAGLIGLTVFAIIVLVWPFSSLAALLLVPYLGWVSFATFLSYEIFKMN